MSMGRHVIVVYNLFEHGEMVRPRRKPPFVVGLYLGHGCLGFHIVLNVP
jgi:hypothetical protein